MIFILTKLNVSSFVLPIKGGTFAQKHYNMDKIEEVLDDITQEVTQADIEKINEEVEEQEAAESTDEQEEKEEPQPSRTDWKEDIDMQRRFIGWVAQSMKEGMPKEEIEEKAWNWVNNKKISVALMPHMYGLLNGTIQTSKDEDFLKINKL